MRDRWHRRRALALGALLSASGCGMWSAPPTAHATSFPECNTSRGLLTLQRFEEVGVDGDVVQTLDRYTQVGGVHWRQQVLLIEEGQSSDDLASLVSVPLLRDESLRFLMANDCAQTSWEGCDDN